MKKIIKIVVMILVLLLVAGGGYFAYTKFFAGKDKSEDGAEATVPQESMRNLKELPMLTTKFTEELLGFTYEKLPPLYALMVQLNDEIVMIDKELVRVEEIRQKFPDQESIIQREVTQWNRARSTLVKSLEMLEKEIEKFYVTSLVNVAKGESEISTKQVNVAGRVNNALTSAATMIERLKSRKKPVGFIGKMMNKFFGDKEEGEEEDGEEDGSEDADKAEEEKAE